MQRMRYTGLGVPNVDGASAHFRTHIGREALHPSRLNSPDLATLGPIKVKFEYDVNKTAESRRCGSYALPDTKTTAEDC